jgi:hypothetical protein
MSFAAVNYYNHTMSMSINTSSTFFAPFPTPSAVPFAPATCTPDHVAIPVPTTTSPFKFDFTNDAPQPSQHHQHINLQPAIGPDGLFVFGIQEQNSFPFPAAASFVQNNFEQLSLSNSNNNNDNDNAMDGVEYQAVAMDIDDPMDYYYYDIIEYMDDTEDMDFVYAHDEMDVDDDDDL